MFQSPPLEKHLPAAQGLAQRVTSTTDYVNAHCWVFTPESFLAVAERLSQIGLFPFAIEYFHPTEYGDYEFYTRLRKSEDAAAIAASLHSARNLLKGAPTEQAYREMLLEKVYGQVLPESSYRHSLHELAQQKKELEDEQSRLGNDIRFLQGLLEEVRTSTSWRLTRPLRWLGRAVMSTGLTRKLLYDPFRRKGRPRPHCQGSPSGVGKSASVRSPAAIESQPDPLPPGLPARKVVFVAGTAFCGSSLLNILLDTQAPAIRGLGERAGRRRGGRSLRRLQYDGQGLPALLPLERKGFLRIQFPALRLQHADRFVETHEPALAGHGPRTAVQVLCAAYEQESPRGRTFDHEALAVRRLGRAAERRKKRHHRSLQGVDRDEPVVPG